MNDITSLTVKALFTDGRYQIPIYQRNYAWGAREIEQLIQDVHDFSERNPGRNYHIGTLVVFERTVGNGIVYETIDGQQRLTTLFILLSALRRMYPHIAMAGDDKNWPALNITFQSRPLSTETLIVMAQDEGERVHYLPFKDYNEHIQQGYKIAIKALRSIVGEESEALFRFITYLLEKVMILRVPVPPDTDLNHYFEIMNSRGEQLEKHEVLKASMLSVLKDDPTATLAFRRIWEACSDMGRYVQYGFTPDQRNHLFGEEWSLLMVNDFSELADVLAKESAIDGEENMQSLSEIIGSDQRARAEAKGAQHESDRFNSVVNFPNFLLHVLRVIVNNPISPKGPVDISLDDKQLIDQFGEYLKSGGADFVCRFGFALIHCRLLFDRYIIKREFASEKERWSLQKLKCYQGTDVGYLSTFGDKNTEQEVDQRLTMLLAMFHVSAPTMSYKHWLSAALIFLHGKGLGVSGLEYLKYMEELAEAFLFDRFLADEPRNYFDIVLKNNGKRINGPQLVSRDKLNQGTGVENFVFNYLDYKLWREKELDVKDFEFSFRSSVEHFYPQHPMDGHRKMENAPLNSFGNLCLIQSSTNSRLSNLPPKAKSGHYKSLRTESLKLRAMMNLLDREDNWIEEQIWNHGLEMERVLLNEKMEVR